MNHHPTDVEGATRRSVLAGASVLATPVLSGCLSGGSSEANGENETGGDGTKLADHPAGTALVDQPRKGPDPSEADAVIVAFEDPSCTRCRAFERETLPKIEEELVAPGLASFVFRGYPVVFQWGEPATHALEATFAQDSSAFWALKDHYYGTQSSFDSDNVLERTRTFLNGETVVNGEAVLEAVESGETEPAVQADLDAGMNAGAGQTTPHIFLFRDGEYQTKAAGSVSFSVIKNALGF